MSGKDVGSVRPTQLIYTYGVGSTLDLPQFSAIVMGLDDWPVGLLDAITEDRLLRVVRGLLGPQVRQLKGAPLRPDRISGPFASAGSEGGAGGRLPALAGLYAMPVARSHPQRPVPV